MFRSSDAADLARVLTIAMTLTPEARQAMGRRGRAHVENRFTLAKLQHDTLAVYDRLLGTNLAPRFLAAPKNSV